MKAQLQQGIRQTRLPILLFSTLFLVLGAVVAWRVHADILAVIGLSAIIAIAIAAAAVSRVRSVRRDANLAELSRLNRAVMETLATAIDAQDQGAQFHARNVEELSIALGEYLNLDRGKLEGLRAAALLHDIGKLAVPDYILNKPDDLTPAEFAKVKMHSVVGSEILSGIRFPQPVDHIVRHHHERYDGKGYPDGLAGEAIPLESRILAVADCFDAVMCDRPYRPRMDREAALEVLLQERGGGLDPFLVDVFLSHLEEIEARVRSSVAEFQSREIFGAAAAHPEEKIAEESGSAGPVAALATISEAQREIYALYELAQMVGTSLNLQDLLAVIASKLERLIPFTTCVLNLADETDGTVRAAHVVGSFAEQFKERAYKENTGITGWVVANRRPVSNKSPDLDFSEAEREVASGFRCLAVYPLSKGNRSLGAISLYSSDLTEYSPDHLRLLEIVALHASDAIFNSIAFEQAARSAETDLLTGLSNARAFHHRFEDEFSRAAENNTQLTILNMDLDGFKAVNDNLGHQAGDRVLIDVAHALRRQFREDDMITRYAGDEFLAILPGINRKHAVGLIARIQQAVDKFRERMRNGQTISVGISIGAASYPEDGNTLEELMAVADRRMFENKRVRKSVAERARKGSVLNFRPPKP